MFSQRKELQQLLNRVCAALRGPLTFPWPDPAPDSIIGILIFKYPPTNNRPLIQLNFFCHILQEGQRKYFPRWKVQTRSRLAPTGFDLASFAKTAPRKRIQQRFKLRLEALTECRQLSRLLIVSSCHGMLEAGNTHKNEENTHRASTKHKCTWKRTPLKTLDVDLKVFKILHILL